VGITYPRPGSPSVSVTGAGTDPRNQSVAYGTAAEWAAANPVLALGELGYETDTYVHKIGDGSTAWASLSATGSSTSSATAAATKRLLSKLKRGVEDAQILVIGDSTGNDTTEWVYLTAQALAARYPAYTVTYYLWDAAGGAAYLTPTTVQTGTGSHTLAVYNASVSGVTPAYVQASRWSAAVAATNPDLIFVSHGHNMGDPGTPTELQRWSMKNSMLSLTEDLALTFPRAGLVLVAQNPSFVSGRETWQAIKATFWEEIAGRRGYGFLDVHQAFTDMQASIGSAAIQATYYTDTTHPNTSGQLLLWFPVVDAALRDNAKSAEPARAVPPIAQTGFNLIPNSDFATWGAATSPAGWTLTGCTATKDSSFFETGTYSCRLDAPSGAGTMNMEYSVTPSTAGIKGFIDGQVVTVAARVYMASGNATTPSLISKDNGGSGTQARQDLSTSITDRWVWLYATRRVAASPTNFTVDLYPRISGTSAGTVYVDRVVAVVGEYALAGGATPGVNPPAAGVPINDLDHLSTISPWPGVTGQIYSAGSVALTANRAVLTRIKPQRNCSITKMYWGVGTTGGNYDIGIYDAAGTLLWSKGSTATPSSGTITETFTAVPLTAGTLYYVAFVYDGTTATIRGYTLSSTEVAKSMTGTLLSYAVTSSLPLPNPITVGATGSSQVPAITLRES
jgi:hypothetical protein